MDDSFPRKPNVFSEQNVALRWYESCLRFAQKVNTDGWNKAKRFITHAPHRQIKRRNIGVDGSKVRADVYLSALSGDGNHLRIPKSAASPKISPERITYTCDLSELPLDTMYLQVVIEPQGWTPHTIDSEGSDG